MKSKYFIRTYGCQMNVHDSERIAGMLDSLGYENTSTASEADVILLNTCAVRERPEHKLYAELGAIRKFKTDNPNLVIGVAGCMAQRDADSIRRSAPDVDIILGPRNIHHLPHLLRNAQRHAGHWDGLDLESDPTPVTPVRRSSSVSAYVDIIFGCNFNCTYCAVPSARGREVSRPPQDILNEVRQLSELGYREITLLGQTVNAYGHDLERLPDGKRIDFAWLLRAIDQVDPTLRIRFISPHPMYFNQKLIDTIAELPSVCEHLHMPLQSGDNACLKRMKRTYTIEKFRDIVGRVREKMPNVAVTTDAIVGFCGESEDEFQNTLQFFREIKFDQGYLFAYSPRHSTAAWEWPDDVPAKIKSRRLAELIELQRTISSERNQELLGQSFEILVEGKSNKDDSRLQGRSRSNKLVLFPGDLKSYPVGSLVEVETREAFLWGFLGEAKTTPTSVPAPKFLIELQPV